MVSSNMIFSNICLMLLLTFILIYIIYNYISIIPILILCKTNNDVLNKL